MEQKHLKITTMEHLLEMQVEQEQLTTQQEQYLLLLQQHQQIQPQFYVNINEKTQQTMEYVILLIQILGWREKVL